ncbi:uncharacterized protein Plekhm1 [Euwallacea fornicatus]|uniref:uncharacterized protein Plekhm1 n=1 Tax=Euwallacea fornicatus TaxID=995702 RepID=UPI00338DEA95
MNKFLKGVQSPSKKDQMIKEAVTTSLSNTIKEIQYAAIEAKKINRVTDMTESANELSSIIEAIFLHGLRDSMSHRFRKALGGVQEKPQLPDFWAPLLIISHRQIIDQIADLTQITTQVGQCRAWIRLTLNDCLLSSYFQAIRQDASALKSYYNSNAYIRDNELMEVAQKLIEGVEASKNFTLPTNSSLLNTWQTQSLMMAGIWSSTLKNTPLAACDDVALIIEEDAKLAYQEEVSDTASLCSAVSYSSQNSGLRQALALTEDEVLKVILAKDKVGSGSEGPCCSPSSSFDMETNKNCIEDSINHNIGNSLNREGWSFDENNEDHENKDTLNDTPDEFVDSEQLKAMESSFTALVESYNMVGGSYIRTPDIRGLWQKFEDKRIEGSSRSPSLNLDSDQQSMINSISNASLVRSESTSLSAQVYRIALERGLDMQNFECAGCKRSLDGFNYYICYYTGDYFCADCMHPEEMAIPARIVHNWDFKNYPLSQKSASYLNEIKDYPVIDFKIVNPYIYAVTEEMAELQVLRNQLNFLRAYLYTCREPVIEQLQKQMWPREYMYEHIHQYSISDLHDIRNNLLASQLRKVVKFGKDHVFGCWLCSQKGFVCEICKNPKALFPFDVENVFRCEVCNAVYHKSCLNSTQPCRKCERRKRREELPLDSAICPK